ncbi:hypothetical protein EW146_g121, partial [Bondarzewia mesenterica]
MTRTARATSPRALMKDRRAGAHNWGNINDEARFEREGVDDEERDYAEGEGAEERVAEEKKSSPVMVRRTSSVTEEDRENALKVRKNALKSNGVDLAAIARSSVAVSSSPPRSVPISAEAS